MYRIFLFLIPAGAVCAAYALKKTKLRTMALSALTGVAALLGADLLCAVFGANLPLNGFTLAAAAVGGAPGVILLNLLTALFSQ